MLRVYPLCFAELLLEAEPARRRARPAEARGGGIPGFEFHPPRRRHPGGDELSGEDAVESICRIGGARAVLLSNPDHFDPDQTFLPRGRTREGGWMSTPWPFAVDSFCSSCEQ
jgi:hypothetical protein